MPRILTERGRRCREAQSVGLSNGGFLWDAFGPRKTPDSVV